MECPDGHIVEHKDFNGPRVYLREGLNLDIVSPLAVLGFPLNVIVNVIINVVLEEILLEGDVFHAELADLDKVFLGAIELI